MVRMARGGAYFSKRLNVTAVSHLKRVSFHVSKSEQFPRAIAH